ncbi:MAG: methyltransferase domain-containing protein [Bacteroidota bacterium]
MKEFAYKEYDLEGMETLQTIAEANQFNEWMYQTTSRQLRGRIIEIGSGIGNISSFYLRDGRSLHLSDIRANYCAFLRDQYGKHEHILGISQIDLVHPEFERHYRDLLGSFDGLFALNVVEHIKDDRLAIANAKQLLRPGGRMVILVPAYQFLYNSFDKALEHYRRYNKKRLQGLFIDNDLHIERSQYFNLAGIAGWFVSGNILRRKLIPSGQMQLYNRLVPLFKLADRLTFRQMGLSVIVEGVKK